MSVSLGDRGAACVGCASAAPPRRAGGPGGPMEHVLVDGLLADAELGLFRTGLSSAADRNGDRRIRGR